MNRRTWLIRSALCLAALVLLALLVRGKSPVAQDAAPRFTYVERITGGAKAEATLPLVVALHGLGDDPGSFVELYAGLTVPARIIAPRAPDPFHVGTSWFPIDDPKRRTRVARERAAELARFMEQVSAEKPTRGRAVVTGFSQGGILSFLLAAYHPSVLSAALPIAGMLEANMEAPTPLSHPLPVRAFHGRNDARIPYAGGARAVEVLKKAGRLATLTSYEGVGHSISPRMRKDVLRALAEVLSSESLR